MPQDSNAQGAAGGGTDNAGAEGAGTDIAAGGAPFWTGRRLGELSPAEWEALCDGCGRCCLNKLEDWDTGEVVWTSLACTLLDGESCRCSDYDNRFATVSDCLQLTAELVPQLAWLPPTCAYRLVAEGRDLYWWHPLVSGDPESVHAAGISVRGQTFPEDGIPLEDYENFVADWPGENPMDEKVRVGFIE